MAHTDALQRALQDWIWELMRHSMHSLLQYLKENELSMSQVGALFQINGGSTNVSDLGEGLGITIAAASQMLERLVQQGLVVRVEDPQDRRSKQLALTEKGRRIVQASVHARLDWIQALAASLSEREREQVAAALRVMTERTRELDRQPEPVR